MSRAQTILSRLPRHLAADTPGKLFGDAVAALAGELDVKTYQLGRVRRAHALADADEEHDLLLHAGAHDRRYEDFEILRLRLAALRDLRAALADPSVLVLDEATSNLDPGTEHQVEHAMDALMHGRTTIVVAHRLSTAARADRIGVVRDGRLSELGSHAELVALGGHYAELYRTWSVHQAQPEPEVA